MNTIIPQKGLTSKSHTEVDNSSNIPENLSNKDSNVNMGEDTLKVASNVLRPPPTTSITPASIVPLHSLIFDGILQQPITSLFSS